MKRIKFLILGISMAFCVMLVTPSAHAGRYILKMRGAMNVVADPLKFVIAADKNGRTILDKYGDPEIIPVARGAAHISTVEHRGSTAEVRLMGAVVDFIDAPPYYFEYRLGEVVEPKYVKGQEKAKPIVIEANRWYTIEFYVITVDDRGKKVRGGELVATGEFMIEDTMTPEIEQAKDRYHQTVEQLKQELANARQEYEKIKADRDTEAARLQEEQKRIIEDYERKLAEVKIEETKSQRSTEPIIVTVTKHEGFVIVFGVPGQTVNVRYSVKGKVVKTDCYTFTATSEGVYKIFVYSELNDQGVSVLVCYSGGDRDVNLGPLPLDKSRKVAIFSSVGIRDILVREGSK